MLLGLLLEELERGQVRRERVERPRAGQRQHRPERLRAIVLLAVVGDVLADPFLAPALEVDDRRLAKEVAAGLELEALEGVRLDLERQVLDVVVQAHRAAKATAVSPASRAFSTISARLTSRVRPSLRSWRNDEHERRHRLSGHPGRGRLGHGRLDQVLDVEALGRRVREQKARASERPVRSCDPRGLRRVLDPLRHGRPSRGRVEERQRARAEAEHGHSERLQKLDGRGHVQERLHARGDDERLRARERRKVGGHVRR